MDTWNAKYKNKWNEYEVKFCSDDYEKAKAVERVCQYIMDGEITSRSDVAPVRRGQWKPAGFTFMGNCVDCSECGYRIAASIGQNWNYCPNCGAKMEAQNG